MRTPYSWKRRAVQPVTVQEFTRGILILCGPLIIVIILLFLFGCSSANAQELPDAPKPNRVWIAEVSTLGGLYASDWTLTAKGLGEPCGARCGNMREWNPILGAHPSNGRIAAYGASLFAGEAILLRHTEKSRRRWVRWGGRLVWAYSVVDEVRCIRSWKR